MKFIRIFFTIFIFSFLHQNSYSKIETEATYVIVQDHFSGKILYEKEADGRQQ